MMDDIFELLNTLVAIGIYGSEERPRHPFWRIALRTFVFGGFAVLWLSFAIYKGSPAVPLWVGFLWSFAVLIVMSAEHYVGRTAYAISALICGTLTIIWAVGIGF